MPSQSSTHTPACDTADHVAAFLADTALPLQWNLPNSRVKERSTKAMKPAYREIMPDGVVCGKIWNEAVLSE